MTLWCVRGAQRTRTEMLMRWLSESHLLQSCSAAFGAFDESVLFQNEFHNISTLKRQFKVVFQVRGPLRAYLLHVVCCSQRGGV